MDLTRNKIKSLFESNRAMINYSVTKEDTDMIIFCQKLNLKCKTTKNNVINSYKEDYFF